jgi:hypothetical protein
LIPFFILIIIGLIAAAAAALCYNAYKNENNADNHKRSVSKPILYMMVLALIIITIIVIAILTLTDYFANSIFAPYFFVSYETAHLLANIALIMVPILFILGFYSIHNYQSKLFCQLPPGQQIDLEKEIEEAIKPYQEEKNKLEKKLVTAENLFKDLKVAKKLSPETT